MNLKIRTLVKNNIKQGFHMLMGAFLLAILGTSCDKRNDLGIKILPGEDLISVNEVIMKDEISAFNFNEENLISSGRAANLGSFNDPSFGSTKIDFAAQFRLAFFPNLGTDMVIDSVKLFLSCKPTYGDTITTQHFKVYELESPLSDKKSYKQDINLEGMAKNELLGEAMYIPKVKINPATGKNDTLYQDVVIPIDNSFGEKLLGIDTSLMKNIDSVLTIFKGLYVQTKPVENDLGSIISVESTGRTALIVYYNNKENKEANKEKEDKDKKSLFASFILTSNSARVNRITHDYSKTSFSNKLNQETEQEDFLYIQPLGGLKSHILINNLSHWKDSVNTTISKAEITFEVDTIASEIDKFAVPKQLFLTFVNSKGEEELPEDYEKTPPFYGGFLYSDYKYRFNITRHIQSIIDGKIENNGFYLTTGRITTAPNRVILRGKKQASSIKLVLAYSKYSE